MATVYGITELRNGTKIEFEGTPYEVTYFQHVNPGKGSAFCRTKLRNLLNGNVLEHTFKAGDKVPAPDLEQMQMQYMYFDGAFHFMNTSTFEQFEVPADVMGDNKDYLIENMEVSVLFYKGRPIGVSLPFHVVLKVTRCDPGVRGDTATSVTKPATVETGAVFQVPIFVAEGDNIKVDTRSHEYIERVNR